MSVLDRFASWGSARDALSSAIDRFEPHRRHMAVMNIVFCSDWVQLGAQVYELQHSIAALLAATRSPPLDFERLPHLAFIIKVPAAFLPVRDNRSADVFVCVTNSKATTGAAGAHRTQLGIWRDVDGEIAWIFGDDSSLLEDASIAEVEPDRRREWLLAIRMVANAVAFITEHRECVERISKEGVRAVHSVRPPRDVVIDRAFRDRVSALVRAGTQTEVRSALAHMVRGHWRNQAVGEGRSERKLTWVRPHRRGDESLGIVTKRTERIS